MHCTILISISAGAHNNEFAMRMFETDEREFNNSSAAELEHK